MASRIPDLLSDSPPPELLSESTHSDLLSVANSTSQPIAVSSRSKPTSSPSHHGGLPRPTPPRTETPSPSSSPSSSGFLNASFSRMASSLTRRLTDPDAPFFGFGAGGTGSSATGSSLLHQSQPEPGAGSAREKRPAPTSSVSATASFSGGYRRTESPFDPPPLTGLTLHGLPDASRPGAQLLNNALAEEIRLLLPPRLQLSDAWRLAFSVERDGVSLHTLYGKCADLGGARARGGWVLVVRDGGGSIFGAYLTDAPHPSATYYGTGECFLWRASMVTASSGLLNMQHMDLPPPPSEDTSTYTQRHVTLASPTSPQFKRSPHSSPNVTNGANGANGDAADSSAPDLLRFKAFPYSGINDYLIYCEQDYLSVGGGDGRYGLWLDSSLEKGVSSACMTFGNEPLAEDGEKFEILGVEMWFVAA